MITAMDMGRNQVTIDASVNILQACLVDKRLVSTNECAALLDALTTIAQASSRKQGDSLMRLLDGTRNLARSQAPMQQQQVAGAADKGKLLQQRNMLPVGKGKDADEPPGARGEMGFILDKWVSQVQSQNDRGALQFILQLLQRGFLKGDEVCVSRARVCRSCPVASASVCRPCACAVRFVFPSACGCAGGFCAYLCVEAHSDAPVLWYALLADYGSLFATQRGARD
jgi:hypothetical protein